MNSCVRGAKLKGLCWKHGEVVFFSFYLFLSLTYKLRCTKQEDRSSVESQVVHMGAKEMDFAGDMEEVVLHYKAFYLSMIYFDH